MSNEVIYPGQFRLSRIQLINWGTFHGTVDIPVAREGFLITGGSGSGKSTMIDAITAVLLPPGKLRFNSAAQANTPRSKGRNLVSYIRGAWRAEEDPQQDKIVSTYLRPNATYSLVGLTYSNGEGVEHTLVAIFYLKSGHNSTADISSFYGVIPNDQDLSEILQFLKEGVDKRRIKAHFKEATFSDKHSVFSSRFRSRLGISSEEALLLLHRAQSAKDLQSLDDLFRNYMLEVPETFDLASTAVEQFRDLEVAYEQVEDIKRQIETLEPLIKLQERSEKAQKDKEHAKILRTALPSVRDRIKRIEQEDLVRRYSVEHTQTKSILESADSELKRAEEIESAAHDQVKRIGGQHETLRAKREAAVERQKTISDARASFEKAVVAVGGVKPSSPEDLFELINSAQEIVEEYPAEREKVESQGQQDIADRTRVGDKLDKAQQELSSLSKSSSNLEHRLLSVRDRIAQELGIRPRDLPFAGELIDPLDEHKEWEPVIQRILGGFAATLLVPQELLPRVRDWVNHEKLNALLKFNGIHTTGSYSSPRLPFDSLVRKVAVVDSPFKEWMNQELGKKFNIRCVETPKELSELGKNEEGVTITGVRRFAQRTGDPTTRWEKDDRRKLGDRSAYRLGSNNDAKVEVMKDDVKRLKELKAAANNRISASVALQKRLDSQFQHAQAILKVTWSQIDVESANQAVSDFDRMLEELNNTPEARELAQRHDAALKTLNLAKSARERASRAEAAKESQLEAAKKELDRLKNLVVQEVPEDIEREVQQRLNKNTRRVHSGNVDEQTNLLQKELDSQIDRKNDLLRQLEGQIVGVLRSYIENWRSNEADLMPEASFVGEALNRLGELRSNRLAEFTNKFLDLMNRMSTNILSLISSRLRNARREIEDRINPINDSLSKSEYNTGRYLHIDVRDQRGDVVKEFQRMLDQAVSGSLKFQDEKQARARYLKIAEIISKLSSQHAGDARWRNTVLDTRRHVRFIGLEKDADGVNVNSYADSASLSGGQAQKLVFFCLAAALRYQLAKPGETIPTYATVILDEAFDRADPEFTRQTMNVFQSFGFHMLLATPLKLIQTLGEYVGSTIVVSYSEAYGEDGNMRGTSGFSKIEKV